ncbi:helix-turn-helix domain-containing protein [Dyadobacter sp. OTU695]|uniref:helix-turn-helix domain-containing protein n=1 Tax=Dyadobacter sp. OTU695 TaxID=3043860 RepID=UPI00313EA7D6
MDAGAVKAARYELVGTLSNNLPSRRDFYKVWLIEQPGALLYHGQQLPVAKPALIFLHPLVPYTFEPAVHERSGYWCIFTQSFLSSSGLFQPLHDSDLFTTEGPQVCVLNQSALNRVTFLFEQIVESTRSDYVFRREVARNLVELLVHEALASPSRAVKTSAKNAASRLCSHFLDLLESQFPIVSQKDELRLRKPSEFASEMAVHVNHLNAVVRQQTGKSTRTLIAERIVAEGRTMLRFSDWTIGDIAFCLGFEYPNHFTAFIKKHTGQTPLSLRNQIL